MTSKRGRLEKDEGIDTASDGNKHKRRKIEEKSSGLKNEVATSVTKSVRSENFFNYSALFVYLLAFGESKHFKNL